MTELCSQISFIFVNWNLRDFPWKLSSHCFTSTQCIIDYFRFFNNFYCTISVDRIFCKLVTAIIVKIAKLIIYYWTIDISNPFCHVTCHIIKAIVVRFVRFHWCSYIGTIIGPTCNTAIVSFALFEIGQLVSTSLAIPSSSVLTIPWVFLSASIYVVISQIGHAQCAKFPFCFSWQSIRGAKHSCFS